MILQFKVKNFLSIREEQTLSFEATADTTLENIYVVEKGKTRVLKVGMIFGANASGKTNILMGLDYLRNFVLNHRQDKEALTEFVPFLLDGKTKNQAGSFELSFFIDDIRYIYSIELNHAYVFNEHLIYYPGIQPALIYARKYNTEKDLTEIEFGSTIKLKASDKALIQGNTLRNMSVIAAYSKLNIDFDELKKALSFFRKKMFPMIRPKTNFRAWTSERLEKSNELRGFILSLLNNADINISGIDIQIFAHPTSEKSIENTSSLLTFEEQKKQLSGESQKVLKALFFQHKLGNNEIVSLPADLESAGTNRLYELGGVLHEVLQADGVLNIDELESSMHPDLVIHFINTFLANSKEAQLVCTTHEINILSEQDNLRKDIVWFTQKSPEGATELYSLADFNIRKELSFINAYKAGKFGAKPRLGSIYLND